ncbi:AAA family ATPase, partial [Klebsiella pneumoniae]|nr:AAA family ATPase [Klebsiella pneumoniae]
ESMLDALRIMMPHISDFRVISAGGYYVPVIKVTEPWGESHEFNMSQISDGTLRGLGILASFYQPSAPEIIALEEPEQ